MGSIWSAIRLHFGSEATGADFLAFSEISSTANDLRIFTKDLRLLQRITPFATTAYKTMELMPDVDSTFRQIAQWRHVITTDLTSDFYQIPLARESMKYCGVATPFRGFRVYAGLAMGMPGSEIALEELMCRVLGDLIHEGVVAKIADDLYGGADSPRVTSQLETSASGFSKSNLKLFASKFCHQLQIYSDLGLDLGLWHSPGLPASNCSPSVLQQARNGWPSKVLYWFVQSPGSRYTPVHRLTIITTRHCRRRSTVSRED